MDPSADDEDQELESPYAYVANNPITRTDPDGRIWNYIAGAVVGAGIEYLSQVAGNVIEYGKLDRYALTHVDGGKIALAGLAGATGVGIASGFSKLATVGKLARIAASSKNAATVVKTAVAVTSDIVLGVSCKVIQGEKVTTSSLRLFTFTVFK